MRILPVDVGAEVIRGAQAGVGETLGYVDRYLFVYVGRIGVGGFLGTSPGLAVECYVEITSVVVVGDGLQVRGVRDRDYARSHEGERISSFHVGSR